jgi:DNA-binding MarR family transcriptional regulator
LPELSNSQTGTGHANQSVPPTDGSLHVVRRLRRAFLSICRCGDVMFSPYRLTTEQYSLMRAVHREPGVRQVDVKDRIFAEPNTVTAMVTLLERRGILRRKPSPVDGRARLLYLTAHGQAVMARLYEDWDPMRAVLRRCFAGKAGQEALQILDTVYGEMERERENLLKRGSMEYPLQGKLEGAKNEISAPPASRGKSARIAPPRASSRSKAKSSVAGKPKAMKP